jgi:hypothetical protein
MADQDVWQAEYARIAHEYVAATTKLSDILDAPDTEPLDDHFEAASAEVDRLQRKLQKHFWSRPR